MPTETEPPKLEDFATDVELSRRYLIRSLQRAIREFRRICDHRLVREDVDLTDNGRDGCTWYDCLICGLNVGEDKPAGATVVPSNVVLPADPA